MVDAGGAGAGLDAFNESPSEKEGKCGHSKKSTH